MPRAAGVGTIDRGSRAAMAAVFAGSLVIGVVGCAGEAPAALPDGITSSILQSRTDVVDGRLVVQIDNGTDGPLTFATLDVTAPGLEPGLHFDGPRTIPEGKSIQYRMDLTPARCDGEAGPAEVAIAVTAASGETTTGTLEATDPYDTLPRLQNSGCLDDAVERIAAFTLADHLRSTGSGVDRRAWLDIAVEPTGAASGSLDLEQVLGTTLLSAESGLNWSSTTAHVESGDGPSSIELPVRPARCDPHAGAEDKRGTILPLVMTTSEGWDGQYELRASATLKEELFAYFTERCGLPTAPVE